MKHFLQALTIAAVLGHGGFQEHACAQAPLILFEPEFTSLPNFHTDLFGSITPLQTTRPIATMSLRLELHGMNQISVGGQPTIFRTDLPGELVPNDSHFLLDPSQFSVLSAFEDENVLTAEIAFDTPVVFPSPFPEIVQAVAIDGHENPDGSFGTFSASGRFNDGGNFSFGFTRIPEPMSLALFALGSLMWGCLSLRRAVGARPAKQ